jgi:hypothetical protein
MDANACDAGSDLKKKKAFSVRNGEGRSFIIGDTEMGHV